MTKRTDIHSPTNIKPEEYRYCFSYSLASMSGGCAVPAVNLDMIRRLRENGVTFAPTGGPGACSVCGANFLHGDVWQHGPSSVYIFIGHDCADKYQMIADRREYEMDLEGARVRSAREHEKAFRAEKVATFLSGHDGLAEALETDHHISRDLTEKLRKYGNLSPAQVGLAFKLAREARERANRVEIPKVPVPAFGRLEIEGTIVSTKTYEGDWGPSVKMTVDCGGWFCWGTAPAAIIGEGLRGKRVRFTATLKPGRESHFALFSRPTGAEIVGTNTAKEG